MTEEEKDRERVLGIVKDLQAATENKNLKDAQTAFANTIAMMCLSLGQERADDIFLATQAMILEVYLAIRGRVREGKPAEVMN